MTIVIAMLSACNPDRVTRGQLLENLPTTFTSKNPDGLQQKVFIIPPQSGIDDPEHRIQIESTITNTGAFAVSIITRSCTLLPEDLAVPAGGMVFVPVDAPDCQGRTADTLSLAPNASTPTVAGSFRIEGASPGIYDVDTRQLLKPAFTTRFRFRLLQAAGR